MCFASGAINGWKRVGGGYAGFSARQSQCKKSKVEIQNNHNAIKFGHFVV